MRNAATCELQSTHLRLDDEGDVLRHDFAGGCTIPEGPRVLHAHAGLIEPLAFVGEMRGSRNCARVAQCCRLSMTADVGHSPQKGPYLCALCSMEHLALPDQGLEIAAILLQSFIVVLHTRHAMRSCERFLGRSRPGQVPQTTSPRLREVASLSPLQLLKDIALMN